MQLFIELAMQIGPLFLLALITVFLIPSKEKLFRITVLIAAFQVIIYRLFRLNYLQVGVANHIPWFRVVDNVELVVLLAAFFLIFAIILLFFAGQFNQRIEWSHANPIHSILVGLGGAALFGISLYFIQRGTPLLQRGGNMSTQGLLAVVLFSISVSFTEEILLRGYLQEQLGDSMKEYMAIVVTALLTPLIFFILIPFNLYQGLSVMAFMFVRALMLGLVKQQGGIIASVAASAISTIVLVSGLI